MESILRTLAYSIDTLQKDSSSYGLLSKIKEKLEKSIFDLSIDSNTKAVLLNPVYHYFSLFVDEGLSKLCYILNYQEERDRGINSDLISDVDKFMKKSKGPIFQYHWDKIKIYINHCEYGRLEPTVFWNKHCYRFRDQILPYLCIPSSSASVERGFSIEKNVHTVTRNRLGDEKVNMEMFFRYNKRYIDSLKEDNDFIVKRRKKDSTSINSNVL